MQIIDAQIHLWATGLPSNQTHWQVSHFTAEEAIVLMDEGGVDAAVIHPPDRDPGEGTWGSGHRACAARQWFTPLFYCMIHAL
jgi:hypothetical protein